MRPDAPSDPPLKTLQLDGAPVAYTDVGEGPVVLALHGCPGSVRDWRWMGPALEPHLRLIRLDLPGFGATPLKSFPDPGFPARAGYCLRLLDQLGVDTFTPMGHSAGGPLALELAARHPERATRLALVAPPGLRPHRPFREHPVARQLAPILRVPVLRAPLTRFLRDGFERSGFPKGLPDDALHQSMHIIRALSFRRQRENVERLETPALIAWAEDDRFIEGEIARELAAACPDGPRLGFDEGGHYLQKTRATEICEALTGWLAG